MLLHFAIVESPAAVSVVIVEVASHSRQDIAVRNLIIQGTAERVLIQGGIAVRHGVAPDIAAFEFDLAVAGVVIVSALHASNIGIVGTCFEVVLSGIMQIV